MNTRQVNRASMLVVLGWFLTVLGTMGMVLGVNSPNIVFFWGSIDLAVFWSSVLVFVVGSFMCLYTACETIPRWLDSNNLPD